MRLQVKGSWKVTVAFRITIHYISIRFIPLIVFPTECKMYVPNCMFHHCLTKLPEIRVSSCCLRRCILTLPLSKASGHHEAWSKVSQQNVQGPAAANMHPYGTDNFQCKGRKNDYRSQTTAYLKSKKCVHPLTVLQETMLLLRLSRGSCGLSVPES